MFKQFKAKKHQLFLCCGTILSIIPLPSVAQLSLEEAIGIAIQNDPWLVGNQLQEKTLSIKSDVASVLPDASLSIDLLNLPTDTFAFDQQQMTQFKLGATQKFHRGDSASITKRILKQQASQHPYQREDHKAKLRVTISQLWLDASKAVQMITLIERNRELFEQLTEIVEASYSSAQGHTRQQDVVSMQLELARLDDKLTQFHSQSNIAIAKLSEWLDTPGDNKQYWMTKANFSVSDLSVIPTLSEQVFNLLNLSDRQLLADAISKHPALLAIEQLTKANLSKVELAKQKYKPQWGVTASYAHRENEPTGGNRPDFFSVGVTVDMPIFGKKKQDSEVETAKLDTETIKTQKRLVTQNMLAQLASLHQELQYLNQREIRYRSVILPKVQEQVDAFLSAYTNDDGVSTDVMRARITQLNTQVDFVGIQIEKIKIEVKLAYFFSGTALQAKLGNVL